MVRDLDENWAQGTLNGKTGNFPKNFVKGVQPPHVGRSDVCFVSTKDFQTGVEGDLVFKKGAFVVGERQLDSNWYHGRCDGSSGMFPLTHVALLPSTTSEACHTSSLSNSTAAPDHSSDVIAKAVANMDVTAQIDDELEFGVGDVIHIVKAVDSEFAIGECNGRTGMFALAFVDIVEGQLNATSTPSPTRQRQSKFRWWERDEEVLPSEQMHNNHTATTSVPTALSDYSEHTNSTNTVEAASFTTSTEIPQQHFICETIATDTSPMCDHNSNTSAAESVTSKTHRRVGSYTDESLRSFDTTMVAYARMLYPFVAENANELTFTDNEIVTLLQHVDEQWIEGEVNGKRGMFPASYVEIIVDCERPQSKPHSTLHVEQLSQPQPATSSFTSESHAFGCVLHDYVTPEGAALACGDAVDILQQLDCDWFLVRKDSTSAPVQCPVTYVDVLSLCEIPGAPTNIATDVGQSVTSEEVNNASDSLPPSPNPAQPTSNEQVPVMTSEASVPSNKAQTKPAILKPKPTLKPKPQPPEKKPQPSSVRRQKVENGQIEVASTQKPEEEPKSARVSVFASNPALRNSSNLDEIIQSQMHLTRQQSEEQKKTAITRNNSTAAAQNKAPPIPDRKNVAKKPQQTITPPQSVPSTWSKSSRASEKRVAGSTFYASPASNTSSSNNRDAAPVAAASKRQVPVPVRPAPPRPTGVKRRQNLIEFSPEKENSAKGLDSSSQEVVSDLERRVAEVVGDLTKYEDSRAQLVTQLHQLKTDDALQADDVSAKKQTMAEELEFVEDQIAGLQEELTKLKESLYQLKPEQIKVDEEAERRTQEKRALIEDQRRAEEEAMRQRQEVVAKRRENRSHVIAETLQTERDFLHSISVCFDVFHDASQGQASPPAQLDLKLLFGNIESIIATSQKLLNALEAATQGKDFEQQEIGQCFVGLRKDLSDAYAPYCKNHDDVISLLEKYEDNSEIQAFFASKLDVVRQSSVVFDFGSILIKPVQRILKYPLLLNELLKNTEDSHIDKPHLVQAIGVMTQVAAEINEYKRGKELVRKYKSTKDEGIGEKFSKLSMHSTKKKFARLSQKMVGFSTVDETFVREERKFRGLEAAVRQFVRDVSNYLDAVKESGDTIDAVANDLFDFYDESSSKSSKQEKYRDITNRIANKLTYNLRSQVERQVLHPLNRLLVLFQAPSNVIKKRNDKLLDYDNLRGKQITNQSDTQHAKAMYEALNTQLLDELPKLYQLSIELLRACVARFVQAQRNYFQGCMEALCSMPDDFLVSLTGDAFTAAHERAVERISALRFVTKAFNPNIDEKRQELSRTRKVSDINHSCNNFASFASVSLASRSETEWSSSQTTALRAQLRSNYGNSKVCIVTSDYMAKGPMELTLSKGTLVGVIKERDPMGQKDRWYIDNGMLKGLFPATQLTPAPVASPSASSLSPKSSEASPSSPRRDHRTSLIGDLSPNQTSSHLAVSAFDHPTLFDAVCSPTFGQILEPQPAANQASPNQQRASQSESLLSPDFARDHSSPEHLKRQSFAQTSLMSEDLDDLFSDEPWYRVMYDFTARTDVELTLRQGQMVKVRKMHDLDDNNEWWLVDANGKEGYAPANYLSTL